MKYTIFYSWQSDLPNNTNRGFISSVLESAIGQINESDFEIELALDRDTKGVPGAPNIVSTIIEKIRKCDVFIADISIIHQNLPEGLRASPNPNVLLELGYALATLGTERTILFFNESYGNESNLPFDIRQNRRITYHLLPEQEKAPLRKELTNILTTAIKGIVDNGPGSHKKMPLLRVSLRRCDNSTSAGAQATLGMLEFDANAIAGNAEQDLAEARAVDGSGDPRWQEKLAQYEKNVMDFLDKLKQDPLNYYLALYKKVAEKFSLLVENAGTSIATDVRVSITVPDDFIVTENYPEIRPSIMPRRPAVVIPRPEMPVAANMPWARASTIPDNIVGLESLTGPEWMFKRQRSHGCSVKGKNEISFWADRLLHKHKIYDEGDAFFLIPGPDWKGTEVTLEMSIFCAEQEEWQRKELAVPIVPGSAFSNFKM